MTSILSSILSFFNKLYTSYTSLGVVLTNNAFNFAPISSLFDNLFIYAFSPRISVDLLFIVFAICLGLVYSSRILIPDVSSYTGEFIESHRNSRVAPPLPVTYEYVFWNSEGKRQVFYLDIFSKKELFPYEFVSDQKYTIYFDEFTNVITKVEAVE